MPLLRPAISEDTPGIWKLIAEVYSEYGFTLDVEADEPHLITPGPYFRSSGGDFLVVDDQYVIKATVAVFLHENIGELKTLYVHTSFAAAGMGATAYLFSDRSCAPRWETTNDFVE